MNKKIMIKINNVISIDDIRKNGVITNLILKYYLRTNVIITNIIRTANITCKIWFYEMALVHTTFGQCYNIANDIKTDHIIITAD